MLSLFTLLICVLVPQNLHDLRCFLLVFTSVLACLSSVIGNPLEPFTFERPDLHSIALDHGCNHERKIGSSRQTAETP